MTFDDDVGYPCICIKCAQPFVVSGKYVPRDGDAFTCSRCRELNIDEWERMDNGENERR